MFGESRMFNKKSVAIAIVLVLVSAYLTLYTFKAHTVSMQYIYEDAGNTLWRRGPAGSLFPWPQEPGMLEIISKIDEVDLFIYSYLIKPGALVGLSILLWFGTGLYTLKIRVRKECSED